ncbi:MAG: cellulase family glycosylhydrolase [Algicola sp.]|nr:cellulase family glycosylhydrolase [Algicola sp.]
MNNSLLKISLFLCLLAVLFSTQIAFSFEAQAQTDVLAFDNDEQNSFVHLSDVKTVSRLIKADFTVEAWVRLYWFKHQTQIVGVLQDDAGGKFGWSLGLQNNEQSERGFTFGLATKNNTGFTYLTAAQDNHPNCQLFDLKRWYHLAGVYDAKAGKMQLFVDGILCSTSLAQSGDIAYPAANKADFNLGRFVSNDKTLLYNGQMSEVRVWHQTRSQKQLRADMSRRLMGVESTLVGYWPLNEGQGTGISDCNGHFAPSKANWPSPWGTYYLPLVDNLPLDDNVPPASACTKTHCGWYTQGSKIHQPNGDEFKIKAVNWFGFQTPTYLVHGLWLMDVIEQLKKIKALGFNTIRLPFAHTTLLAGAKVDGFIADLPGNSLFTKGMPAMDALDAFIKAAGEQGLNIILDRHSIMAGVDDPDLWYTDDVSQQQWIEDWQTLALRYRDNPIVIGADLNNEAHDTATWGTGHPLTDWRMAAQKGGDAVLAINPNWLIIVEGIDWSDDYFETHGTTTGGIEQYPLTLNTPDKVVYSPHEYGPDDSGYRHRWFGKHTTYAEAKAVWDSTWGYIVNNNIAPVLVGEFGGRYVDKTLTELLNYPNRPDEPELTQGDAARWFEYMVDYLDEGDVHFAFWGWTPNSTNTGGLIDDQYEVLSDKIVALYKLLQVNSSLSLVDDALSLMQGQTRQIAVLSNDTSSYGELVITSVTTPAKGQINLSDNVIIYTPDHGACGPDSFEYTVTDGLTTQTAKVSIIIVLAGDLDSDYHGFNPDQLCWQLKKEKLLGANQLP